MGRVLNKLIWVIVAAIVVGCVSLNAEVKRLKSLHGDYYYEGIDPNEVLLHWEVVEAIRISPFMGDLYCKCGGCRGVHYACLRFVIEGNIIVGYTFLEDGTVRIFKWDTENQDGFIEVADEEQSKMWLEVYKSVFGLGEEDGGKEDAVCC